MNEKNHMKAVLQQFGCSRAPTVESIMTDLGVNSTESILTIKIPVIKEIKKRLASPFDSTV